MAKAKKNVTQDINKENENTEFDDTIVDVDLADDVDADAPDQLVEIDQMLADPTIAVKMQETSDENEEVLYCPHCGVTGLFVDNVCLNCGEKKSKKSSVVNEEDDDFEEDTISLDEF